MVTQQSLEESLDSIENAINAINQLGCKTTEMVKEILFLKAALNDALLLQSESLRSHMLIEGDYIRVGDFLYHKDKHKELYEYMTSSFNPL